MNNLENLDNNQEQDLKSYDNTSLIKTEEEVQTASCTSTENSDPSLDLNKHENQEIIENTEIAEKVEMVETLENTEVEEKVEMVETLENTEVEEKIEMSGTEETVEMIKTEEASSNNVEDMINSSNLMADDLKKQNEQPKSNYQGIYNFEKPKKVKKPVDRNIFSYVLSSVAILVAVFALVSNRGGTNDVVVYRNVDSNQFVNTTEADLTEVIADSSESVVEIRARRGTNSIFGNQSSGSSSGSGVIMSQDGFIITNFHVVDGATDLTVTLNNGEKHKAKYIGGEKQNDIAVLKIEKSGLRPIIFADSSTVRSGESVYAIGNPLGTLGGSVTDGIISSPSRFITVEGGVELSVIQHSAPISPGNSGGALVNSRGELVGITTAKSVAQFSENIGFAIPSNDALSLASDIIEFGYVKKPVIGITVKSILTEEDRVFNNVDELGIYIDQVAINSDARVKGIEVGDRIISVDNKEINEVNDIQRILKQKAVGDTLKIVVERDNKVIEFDILLTESVA